MLGRIMRFRLIGKSWCFISTILHLHCYIGPGTTWTNEMNFVVNHAPDAGWIARPVD